MGYQDLITTIRGEKNKVSNQTKPITVARELEEFLDENEREPIRILGIITNEVTIPSMDGTPGCALYKIPFRLSRRPSSLWCDIFLKKMENAFMLHIDAQTKYCLNLCR